MEKESASFGEKDAAIAILLAWVCGLAYEFSKGEPHPFRHAVVVGQSVVALFLGLAATVWVLERTGGIPSLIVRESRRVVVIIRSLKSCSRLLLPWAIYSKNGRIHQIWKLRGAIRAEYIEEEFRDISGMADLATRHPDVKHGFRNHDHEGRPLIVTTFTRYAQLVESLVSSAQRAPTKSSAPKVVCLTTLSLPLTKWFNFDSFRNCIHQEWQRYLEFVEQLSQNERVVLARILLIHEQEKPPDDRRIRLRSKAALTQELNYRVWLTRPGEDLSDRELGLKLRPIPKIRLYDQNSWSREELFHVLTAALPTKTDELASILERSDSHRSAYVLLDEALAIDNAQTDPHGEFGILGAEFAQRFHSADGCGGFHAYYAETDPILHTPFHGTKLAAIPTDFFFVGLRRWRGWLSAILRSRHRERTVLSRRDAGRESPDGPSLLARS